LVTDWLSATLGVDDLLTVVQSSSAAETFDVEAALRQEGLTQQDYVEIQRRLGRDPNRAELGMFGVMWSEHC